MVRVNHLMLLLLLLFSSFSFAWFDASFGYRTQVSVNNTGSALSGYALNLTLDTASLVSAGRMRGDCSDMRFVSSSGVSLPYWVASGCNMSDTKVWVNVSSLPSGVSNVSLYYGSGSAASASNVSSIFVFASDFASSSDGWAGSKTGAANLPAWQLSDPSCGSTGYSGYMSLDSCFGDSSYLNKTVVLPSLAPGEWLYLAFDEGKFGCDGGLSFFINSTSLYSACRANCGWGYHEYNISSYAGQQVLLRSQGYGAGCGGSGSCGGLSCWGEHRSLDNVLVFKRPSQVPRSSLGIGVARLARGASSIVSGYSSASVDFSGLSANFVDFSSGSYSVTKPLAPSSGVTSVTIVSRLVSNGMPVSDAIVNYTIFE